MENWKNNMPTTKASDGQIAMLGVIIREQAADGHKMFEDILWEWDGYKLNNKLATLSSRQAHVIIHAYKFSYKTRQDSIGRVTKQTFNRPLARKILSQLFS